MSSPPVISALPAVPATSDPNFETLAPALFTAIKNTFISEVNSVASWINAGNWLTTPPVFDSCTITGNLKVDTNTLFVDATNNRVGIGTSSPLGKLDVRATSGAQIVASYDASTFTTFTTNSSGNLIISPTKGQIILQASQASSPACHVINNTNANANGAATYYYTANGLRGSVGALKHGTSGDVLFTGETTDGFGIRAETVMQFGIGSTGVMQMTSTGLRVGSLANPSTTIHSDGPVRVGSYTVGTVPSASTSGAGSTIYVSNESGGAVLAFSDGTNWLRVTDRNIIS